jgi:hypothetical protein
MEDVPPKVTINEALEVAKFNTHESAASSTASSIITKSCAILTGRRPIEIIRV